MKYLHIVPGADDVANGMARVARLLAKEQGDAEVVDLSAVSGQSLAVSEGSESLEEVWVHGMWLPKEWAICRRVIKAGKRLVRMTHGSLSPIYLKQQGRWKKWLVGPIERYWLRKADRIVATCDAEKAWIEAYEPGVKKIEIVDIKRFFKLSRVERVETCRGEGCFGCVEGEGGDFSRVERVDRVEGESFGFRASGSGSERYESNSQLTTHNSQLNLLYLGRRHPLKGVEYLETAVRQLQNSTRSTRLNIELRIVSDAKGEELEKVWEWCDVLVLPTLSENFGLVVAEALERGKRVITTDGAPAWGDGLNRVERVETCRVGGDGNLSRVERADRVDGELRTGFGGRLIYLKEYRDGSDEERVRLLKDALMMMV